MATTNDDKPHVTAGQRYALERIKRRKREKMSAPDGREIDRVSPWPPTDPNAREGSAR